MGCLLKAVNRLALTRKAGLRQMGRLNSQADPAWDKAERSQKSVQAEVLPNSLTM